MESLEKVRKSNRHYISMSRIDSWIMAIVWQEHDQDVYERLGVAGRAEVEASHGNAPGARLFLAFTIQYACACVTIHLLIDPVCELRN